MSTAPTRGIVPQRQRRHHHHHHHHHQKHQRRHSSGDNNQKNNFPTHNTNQNSSSSSSSNAPSNPIGEGAAEEKRPKVNPIFLWAAQCEQRIVEIRCEDYDKRNRIKLTKTPQGWRSIPRTALTTHPVTESTRDDDADRHCEQIFSTNAKNEEKENTSADGMKLKKLKIDQIDDGQIDGVDDAYGEKERHKHKKKKHGEKRKIELVGDQVLSETLVTTSWKMKKRRKLDKLKKRKRLMLEQEIVDKIKVDNLSEVKIKEEFKKKYESINDIKKTDTSSVNDARDKKSVDDEEVDAMDGEHKKCNDFGKLKENQNLQPRVVLEQLHLSQLPTKIHNIISRTELEANLEKNVSNSSEASVLDNFNQNNSDDNIDLDSETAAVNKEDLEEILNMLDSNHFPISVKETKPNLIDSTDLTRSCTKLGGASFIDQTEKHSKPELANCEKKERNLKRSASKSLDETIQRLEKSVKHQKTDNSSQEKPVKIVDYNKNEKDLSECESNNVDFTNCTATSTDIVVSTSSTNFDKESELAALKNAEILTVLRKTPDITVSLATKPTEKNYKNPNLPAKTILPTSKSPDSQTNFAEKIEKNFPELSITVPSLQYSSKIGSTVSKNRIESPESTVNFLKHENQFSDADLDEYDVEDYNDAIVKNVSHNNYKHYKNPYDSQNYRGYGNPSENDNTTPTRYTSIPNLKPISRTILRNSEAQAKKLNLSKQSDNNFNDERTDDIHSTISPPCNKISLSTTPSKQSSYHLERLLPSPPCSVTCSEDAKNDLTIKSILSNSKSDKSPHNYIEEESDLNLCHSSDSSRTRKNSEEHYLNKFTKDNSISMSPKLSKNKTDNTELNNPKRPMSNDNLYNPFSVDYVDSNCSLPPNWCSSQKLFPNLDSYGLNNVFYSDQKDFVDGPSVPENFIAPTIFLDPASQLRKLIKTSGDMIPDPLLVPREYLPLLAGAPLTEIPKLLAARPELRLPEALSRPELLRDPDLLVISLAHLQHVLDHGEGPVTKIYQPHEIEQNQVNEVKDSRPAEKSNEQRPKLSCKPIGKLMPSPIDLSHSHKLNPNPPLLRVRSGLLKEEPEVSSTANSPDDSQLWHPLFGSKTQRQRLEQPDQQAEQAHQASWHRTTLAS